MLTETTSGRAEIAALAGDFDTAERLCDTVLERFDSAEPAELRTAVRISASVAARRGMTTRSAQLYTWLGPDRVGADGDLARVVAWTAGEVPAEAAPTSAAPPTASVASTGLLAGGLRQSVEAVSTADVASCTNTLMRAVSLSASASDRIAPDSAAAVAATFALHSGDLARAESIVLRAISTLPAGHHDITRLTLLHAWSTMLAGDLVAARQHVDCLQIPPSHTRDRLFAHALYVGLARRSGDSGMLSKAWDEAQDVVATYSVDLTSLLPLGELWLAAIRVAQPERIAHLLAQADAVSAGLSEPSCWMSALHWYGVQAAIMAETPTAMVQHARALAEASETNAHAATLAAAGRAWLAVLQGRPNVTEVEASAEALAQCGLPWDGARLASEAALRVDDTRAATALLQVARSLRQPAASVRQQLSTTSDASEPKGSLSAREAEVAELLVLGVTYREVGARLFISAKTVEHHVARIRRRLGAGSRSELLSMLRALGYGSASTDD